MISEKPAKDWKRPRDWRWVNYNKKLPGDLVLSIRSLTALCSEETTSPKNARELSSLIRELIVFTPEEKPEAEIDFAQIRKGISKGKSDQNIKVVEDIRIINSSYTLASQVYLRLHDELEGIYTELLDGSIPVKKDRDIKFDSFYEQLVNASTSKSSVPYRLMFGDQKSRKFYVRVVCLVYRPSLLPYEGDPPLPESSNIFAYAIQRHADLSHKSLPNRLRWLTIERTGEWMLRDERMENPERTDVNQIGQIIRSWISGPEVWEAIQSDQ